MCVVVGSHQCIYLNVGSCLCIYCVYAYAYYCFLAFTYSNLSPHNFYFTYPNPTIFNSLIITPPIIFISALYSVHHWFASRLDCFCAPHAISIVEAIEIHSNFDLRWSASYVIFFVSNYSFTHTRARTHACTQTYTYALAHMAHMRACIHTWVNQYVSPPLCSDGTLLFSHISHFRPRCRYNLNMLIFRECSFEARLNLPFLPDLQKLVIIDVCYTIVPACACACACACAFSSVWCMCE